MTVAPMLLVFALAMPAVLGVLALRTLGVSPRDDRLGFPAWAWLVGCLVLAASLQCCLELRVPPRWFWIAPLAVAAGLAVAQHRSTRVAAAPSADAAGAGPPRCGRPFALAVAAGAVLVLLHIAAGMDRPCVEADEGNIWSLKAKSLLFDWPARFAAMQHYNLHADYPHFDPLLQLWIYALHGDVVHFENRLLVQLHGLALWFAVAAALRARLPALPAAALAAVVLFDDDFLVQCRLAYADGMLALGLAVALDAWLRWRDGGSRAFAWLAALALAAAAWAKNETALYLASAGLATLLARAFTRPLAGGFGRRNLVLLLPTALLVAGTVAWNRRFGLRSDLLGDNPTGKSLFTLLVEQGPERAPVLLRAAGEVLLDPRRAHGLFVLLPLAVLLVPRAALGARLALPTLALAGAFVGVHVVYAGSWLDVRFHLDTSHTRVLFHLVPALAVWIAALTRDFAAASDSQLASAPGRLSSA
jgi:hypothetical protein